MTTKEIYQHIIETGNFVLSDIEEKIEINWIAGKLSLAEKVELENLAAEKADDSRQIDIAAVLADLEARIEILESAGVVVWKSGMSVKKGQTVLFDIIGEGQLRYCRYDGGRSYTTLRPGKIEGWVVLASAGGAITHTVEKDSEGNIILVPVETTEE